MHGLPGGCIPGAKFEVAPLGRECSLTWLYLTFMWPLHWFLHPQQGQELPACIPAHFSPLQQLLLFCCTTSAQPSAALVLLSSSCFAGVLWASSPRSHCRSVGRQSSLAWSPPRQARPSTHTLRRSLATWQRTTSEWTPCVVWLGDAGVLAASDWPAAADMSHVGPSTRLVTPSHAALPPMLWCLQVCGQVAVPGERPGEEEGFLDIRLFQAR